VADKIHHEWLRQQKKTQKLELTERDNFSTSEPETESEYECLQDCLKILPDDDRELIVSYYSEEKKAKIEFRRELALKLGISNGALQVRTCRIRAILQKCVQKCVCEKKS
jgi:DNA-directed RNA polymerase specialized sigma24 family protein